MKKIIMKNIYLVFTAMMVLMLTGCADISGSGIADFGTTEADQEVMDHFTDKYGDVTQSGSPKIIEILMTSSIVENLPIDKVLKYSSSSDKQYVWFVYDNFKKGDDINIEWKYLETNKIIKTFDSQTGKDFGRGFFSLDIPENMPDNKWPLGKYVITISGNDLSETVEFLVVDGEIITTNLPWEESVETKKVDSGNTPDTKTYDKLYGNNNVGGCGYTDKSIFEVPVKSYVSKIRMWYYWAEGETQLPFTLKKDGKEIISGILMREDCDPYQTSWCEGNYYPKSNFEAGTYELKVDTAKLCQNSQSDGNGMYMIFGKELGTKNEGNIEEDEFIGTTTQSGFTIAPMDCPFTGEWTSNWGDMFFEQTENNIVATYTHDQGRVTGVMMGNVLVGTWSEAPSYTPTNDAGDIEIEISTDCKSFTGNWRYGSDGSWSGDWTGTKI